MAKQADTEDNASSTSVASVTVATKVVARVVTTSTLDLLLVGQSIRFHHPLELGFAKSFVLIPTIAETGALHPRHHLVSKRANRPSSMTSKHQSRMWQTFSVKVVKLSRDLFITRKRTRRRVLFRSNDQETDAHVADVPPDDTLEKMNIIINKRLKNVSISQYYETVWSEQSEGDNVPLYRSFLEESGKQDIVVGGWEVAQDNTDYLGDWDGEKYQKKRVSCTRLN